MLSSDPELVSELVALVQAEGQVPDALRALAVRTLAVLLSDRARHAAVIAAINGGAGQVGAWFG